MQTISVHTYMSYIGLGSFSRGNKDEECLLIGWIYSNVKKLFHKLTEIQCNITTVIKI